MYVDAFVDIKNNIVRVAERVNGLRVEKNLQTSYFLYYEDHSGSYVSTTGVKCSKFLAPNYDEFKRETETFRRSGRKTFESDIKPLFKSLEEHYKGCALPDLHIAIVDVETDYDQERGFSSVDEAFMPIIAVSVRLKWLKQTYTFVLKPKLLNTKEAIDIVAKFPNTILCDSESQLLDKFLTIIEDADVITGWNSSAYDIPYIVHRITKVRGKQETSRLCLWKQLPKKRTFEQYGDELTTYDLFGRIHLDYLELYRKYTYHELPSFRLDYVGQIEVGENKVAYTGTLDELYNNDFEKFIAYNRQDVDLLDKIDNKNNFINIVNIIAHENLVNFHTVGGAVGLSDNAILLEIHNRGMVSPERVQKEGDTNTAIAGAFVIDPNPGIQEWVAVTDINSLYPSDFRALNMSPETIIGYIKQDLTDALFTEKKEKHLRERKRSLKEIDNSELWSGIFEIPEVIEIQNKTNQCLTICYYDNHPSQTLTSDQIWNMLIRNNWLISANGVIFRTDIQGVIPSLLSRWYSERKEYQKKLKEVSELYDVEQVESKKIKLGEQKEYWDKRQYVVKIALNSVYGALTNVGSRYFDQRLGQSCTLTGRCITRHMGSKINETLTGEYCLGKTICGGDTDSIFFTPTPIKESLEASGFELNKDTFIQLANSVADVVNDSFPEFLNRTFNVPLENGKVIKCGREICAERVLFIKKKIYACLYYDKENKRKDIGKPGDLKLMGIETERADTPVWVQNKLEEMIMLVLTGANEETTLSFIKKMRNDFEELKPWEKGTPKRVNNMTHYFGIMQSGGKNNEGKNVTIPGHVRASINWNRLREMQRDYGVSKIADGQKVIVCRLKPNNYKINSIAIPIDQLARPLWFDALPFDETAMTEAIIDKKVSNIIGVLGWDLAKTKESEVMASQFDWN